MSISVLLTILLIALIPAFIIGLLKARRIAEDNPRAMHSRAGYYGGYLALWTVLPALIFTLLWAVLSPTAINMMVRAELPATVLEHRQGEVSLIMGTIDAVARGLPYLTPAERSQIASDPAAVRDILGKAGVILASEPEPYVIAAADHLNAVRATSRWLMTGIAALLALAGFVYAFSRISAQFRARNSVESVIRAGLIAASTVAILTTLGIIMSVLGESVNFFKAVNPLEFLFGTVWDPRFAGAGEAAEHGQFGLVPLLWGTLFISAIALATAVPLGLFSAVYMSEYAHPRVRAAFKPLLEILAGIPTIVYGFFALITIGPFLRDTGALFGLQISATSALGAGLVMGIMIVPFVSSLSDDIISAVPQALREGSFALGATKSETIRQVVLPAALPGIVGAVLLAGSRAIGETMIVVLAAGIAANLTFNPLESVTTITVKIVSQLTGDLEFNTPQTLVAFALGLTLFTITLGMNIYALHIVRKYREQYE
ncbi:MULTISPECIES: phosphate ABC transporter permease subunit PstC [Rhodomicrobium]|uniref:phosphate ABC transporter permease subunit PstC n=1 Tax=Rhodomicrobium TaxID=1068 RepID=UPI000B4B1EEF|nr:MULTISPECIES: phosphate ABC transporter permease subunit PstC [Rhodomicrobium]